MDKVMLKSLVDGLVIDYLPNTREELAVALEGSDFERGRVAGIAMVIDSLERLIESEDE